MRAQSEDHARGVAVTSESTRRESPRAAALIDARFAHIDMPARIPMHLRRR